MVMASRPDVATASVPVTVVDRPGLFEQIGERFGVDLKATPVVGDTPRDLQAGAAE